MRLIDADALGIGLASSGVFSVSEYADGWNNAVKIIMAAPTVDAAPIVRCKDCIYAQDFDDDDARYDIGRICMCASDEDYIMTRWADDFCSYGERRDDE